MKTPAPERAAGRRKLAAKGQALSDGSEPIPDVAYLKKAIRSVGRLDPSKRPALKRLIVKRARELKATNAPGVAGTWAFQAANDAEAIEMATTMTRRLPQVRGMADVRAARTAPSAVTVMHKSTGAKIGTVVPSAAGGFQGVHADGTRTPAAPSLPSAMAGLIAYHNRQAAKLPPAQQDGTAAYPASVAPKVKGYAGEQEALDLAGALPVTSNASSTDGPRVTTMGGAGKPGKVAARKIPAKANTGTASPGGVTGEVAKVYKKLLAKGLKPAQAMALAKRAASMHAKAAA